MDSQVIERVKELEQRSLLTNTEQSLAAVKGEEIERLALLDSLTDLYNSRTFTKEIKDELKRAKRYKRPVALCMVAIDGFKDVVKQYGALTSDAVIKVVAEVLKGAIRDALLMRGSRDFDSLAAYRAFIDELISRHNARKRCAIDVERDMLLALPRQRTQDFEEALVRVTSSGGFALRKVFYTVPSRLIGHQLRVRVFDDRLELFIGATALMTLPRGKAAANGKRGHVVDYRHVIHALRRKPMALLNLVYRDQLFPRDAYRRTFEVLLAELGDRAACRRMVELLSLAHDRGCEAELAAELEALLETGQLPDMAALRERFGPDPAALPHIHVPLGSLADYEALLIQPAVAAGGEA